MVRGSSLNSLSLVCLPFLGGKKPSKTKLSQGNPDFTMAGTKAVGPGRHSIFISLRMHSRTSKNPGSEMAGVPASDTSAKIAPAFMRAMILVTV